MKTMINAEPAGVLRAVRRADCTPLRAYCARLTAPDRTGALAPRAPHNFPLFACRYCLTYTVSTSCYDFTITKSSRACRTMRSSRPDTSRSVLRQSGSPCPLNVVRRDAAGEGG